MQPALLTMTDADITPTPQLIPKVEVELSVLIAEDDLAFRPFWERILVQCGLVTNIDWVTTTTAAENLIRLKFRRAMPYDLVIADICLDGERTGVDLWNRWGEEAKNFLFVSGLPISKADLLMSLDFGCPTFLKKPLSAKTCREAIHAILNRRPPGGK